MPRHTSPPLIAPDVRRGRRRGQSLVLSLLLVGLAAGLTLVGSPAQAVVTNQTASCVDGSGVRWTSHVLWGSPYKGADGTTRVTLDLASWTTTQAGPVSTASTVRTFNAAGKGLQWLDWNGTMDYRGGTVSKIRHLDDPVSAPGLNKVTVKLRRVQGTAASCTTTFLQPGSAPAPTPTPTPTPTPAPAPTPAGLPTAPPAKICDTSAQLTGPASAPAGAVVVPAGNNASVDFGRTGTTYWFAPGVHTLGTGEYDQIVPGTGSTYVGGPGAIIDGQGKNAYAFTQHASQVTISYLTIRRFVAPMNEGTVNHDSGADWTIKHNTIEDNGGAGLFLGPGNTASYNCLRDNSQYGFQVYDNNGGTSGVVLDHNEVSGNNTGNWEVRQPGCGCTGGGKFWDARNVRVTSNYVHDNLSVALWADTNDNNFLFQGNWIENNAGQAIFWEISYNAAIRDNVIKHNLTATGPERIAAGDNFPDAAIYISESGGDARLPYGLVGSATIDISGNLVEDNYNGVTLWESADRFCGSPANTSSDYCTLVNPTVAKVSTCNSSTIAKQPYYSDCRWKTQNVKVHDNTFRMAPSRFGGCVPTLCGRNAIFSNYGTYPSWSPYQGDTVSKAIVQSQGNSFHDNAYVGPWHFTAWDTGRYLSPTTWRAAPYNQDAGSTFTG